MSIIKKALDKAEQENKNESNSAVLNNRDSEEQKKNNELTHLDSAESSQKNKERLKQKVKIRDKNNFFEKLLFYILLIALVVSIPIIIKTKNPVQEYQKSLDITDEKLKKNILESQNSITNENLIINTDSEQQLNLQIISKKSSENILPKKRRNEIKSEGNISNVNSILKSSDLKKEIVINYRFFH